LNLVDNAIDRTPLGGEIDVALIWSGDLDKLKVGVTDRGPRIRKTDRTRIFRKDFTLRYGKRPGLSGLGVAFCKLAVRALRGQIWIENIADQETCFQFSIPNAPPGTSVNRR
jgi:signal transduction histidine kinase